MTPPVSSLCDDDADDGDNNVGECGDGDNGAFEGGGGSGWGGGMGDLGSLMLFDSCCRSFSLPIFMVTLRCDRLGAATSFPSS